MGESEPLLGKVPAARVKSPSGLNPLATSFNFRPKAQTALTASPTSSTSQLPPAPTPNQQTWHSLSPAQAMPSSPSVQPLSATQSTEDLHWSHQRAHTLSPHTRATSVESGSSFSFASDIPSQRAFRRAHLWIQFPLVFIITVGLCIGLAVWKNEVRWWDLGLGACAWLASETLKAWVFDILTHEARDQDGKVVRGTGLAIPTLVMAIVQELLRLGAIILCVALLPEPSVVAEDPFAPTRPPPSPPQKPRHPLPPLDTLFFSALWLAMGWAIAEILWNSRDFYQRMQLYDEVLQEQEQDDWDEEEQDEEDRIGRPFGIETVYGSTALTPTGHNASDLKSSRVVTLLDPPSDFELTNEEREEEVEAQIRQDEREEVEGQLGCSLYEIPIAVVIIWRLDSILLSLVLTLFLSLPFRTTSPSIVPFPIWPTFFISAATHALLSLLWVLRIPSVGIPSVSYATLVVLVFLLFAVLGAWGALV
ncbi:hypothetical protein P7C70_g871, partial [Phenoliferia sp. Uapishka_3]